MLKLHKDSFHSWLTSRIYRAATGDVLDHETGEYVGVETASAEILLEDTRRRGEYNRQKQGGVVLQKALDQAKADPDDPFSFARTKAHLENGLCGIDDYDVEFRRIPTDLLDFSGTVVGRKMVDMPMKVRRA